MQFRTFFPLVLSVSVLTGCASGGGKYNSPSEWVSDSRQGSNLILGETADTWSEGKTFNKGREGEVEIKSRFVKHFGTTCVYDIAFTNTGTMNFKEGVTLVRPDQEGQYYHNTVQLDMKPGESYTVSGMELRECSLHWGESKDPNACATCSPRVGFMNR